MRTARMAAWAVATCLWIAAGTAAAKGGAGQPAGRPAATGTVSGIVTDEEGKPLAGATAEVHREGTKEPARATSDAKGFYAVRGLPPGKATVVVRAKGRMAAHREVLVPSTGLAVADAKLLPGVRFAGKVVDLKGVGVAGVRIVAFGSSGEGGLAGMFAMSRGDATRSGPDGAYELDGIAPGHAYTLRFIHPRYVTVDLPGLDATAGGGHDGLEALLEDAAWVTGTVVGSDGKPIAGASVSAGEDPFTFGSEDGWIRVFMRLMDEDATPPTDAKGRFTVGSLPEGPAKIVVQAEGHFTGTVEVADLVPGKEKSGVVVTLETAKAVVEGTVTDDLGAAVGGADVTAWGEHGRAASATSDAKGRFRLQRVASKQPVSLRVDADGHEAASAQGVALDSKDAKVVLRRLGRMTVRVLGPDGKPVPRVLVRTLVSDDNQGGGSLWMEQGAAPVSVELPLGRVEVVVEAQGCASKSVAAYDVEPGACFDAGTVTLEAGAPEAPANEDD
ncbi:MAG TPA: carboxypeptidase regulatory-like domain-containing protein [Planctomycetota bacterium]|nr:carboxypeptidase regulatory-like domain-containing protein [Planctomycetota bacterium]